MTVWPRCPACGTPARGGPACPCGLVLLALATTTTTAPPLQAPEATLLALEERLDRLTLQLARLRRRLGEEA